MSVQSLRKQQSGQLMDDTFDDLSDGDESDAEVECRRRTADWRNNSLLAAGRAASAAAAATTKGKEQGGRMLARADTMEVVENSFGTRAITAGCHFPDEAVFARQYLSTLFCGMGESMGCGGGNSSNH